MIIRLNGINLYYKKSGQGDPIILLHGNGQDHTIFRSVRKKLSGSYTVYAIDSRGHGKSSRVKSLDYQSIMEDVAEFIRVLEIDKPILYGFSDGGIIGLLLAISYPEMLDKLIISGANLNPDGIKKSVFTVMRAAYFITRSKKLKMMLTQPDITEEQLSTIVTPTLILAGRHDVVKEEHTRFIASCIEGSELRILAGESHASYVLDNEKLYDTIKTFISRTDRARHVLILYRLVVACIHRYTPTAIK